MGIIRVSKNSNYVVMNRTALNDKRLSWKAKGIMAYMLSMPDDWVFYMDELMTHSTDGRDSFRSGFKELKDAGYVERRAIKDEQTKKIIEWETIVHEVPIDSKDKEPLTEKPQVEKPEVGKPQVENPTLLSTDINQVLNKPNTDINAAASKPSVVDFNFQKLVNFYHQNVGPLYPVLREELGYLLDTYQNTELIIAALTKAVSINANNKLKYTEATLRNWRNENITSVEMLKAKEVQRNGTTQGRYAAGNEYKADLGF